MCGAALRLACALLCAVRAPLAAPLDAQEVVPLRVDARVRGRVWQRSAERPRFVLSAFGTDLVLDLVPDPGFLAPSFTVERVSGARAPQRNRTRESAERLRGCFYSGSVDRDRDSVVAVSLCSGMRGGFITEGTHYLIEPKRGGGSGGGSGGGGGPGPESTEQTHVIRRRTHPDSLAAPLRFDDAEGFTRGAEGFTRGRGDASRRRRFVSAPRFVETLLVADASMTQFYGDEIKLYLLTLLSMAAQLYKHASIRNSLSLVVVKMVVVEDQEVGPQVSSNGGVALRNFCTWQQHLNPPSQRHPEHYDTAMLFTRQDLCGATSCATLGVADVGTVCDPRRSCSVVEDHGLQAALTAAHELGHVLSMPHDDSRACRTLFGDLGGRHLMAPLLVQLNRTAPWSPCSALHVTDFLDGGHGDCLLDAPDSPMPLPPEPPGRRYSLDQQCQQVFGEDFLHCGAGDGAGDGAGAGAGAGAGDGDGDGDGDGAGDGDACVQLWCREDGTPRCSTRNGSLPWADGTPCWPNGTCLHGACRPPQEVLQPLVAVDGGWSPWGAWQRCSRTCGGGVEFSYRDCGDPVPQNGGRYCEGQRVQYRSCNVQPCAPGKSFREQQCEKFNFLDADGNGKHWTPKYAGVSPRDRCKLVCRARGSSEFKVFESKVADGTPCGADTSSLCVRGRCVKAGCDQVIGSSRRTDRCGVCGGRGLTCRKVSGSYSGASLGYSDVVTIPAGATNIDVKRRRPRGGARRDGSYLAVRGPAGAPILNGNFSVSPVEQDLAVGGAVLRYSGSAAALERLQSFGRLAEALTVQLLATAGHAPPPKVKYSFFIPRDLAFDGGSGDRGGPAPSTHAVPPLGAPRWILGEWSACSKSCGSGWSRRDVDCRDRDGFPSARCDPGLRPGDIRPCADLPCPIWQPGPWSSCSPACGGGGRRRRGVVCLDYTGAAVEPHQCDPAKVPEPVSGDCPPLDCL